MKLPNVAFLWIALSFTLAPGGNAAAPGGDEVREEEQQAMTTVDPDVPLDELEPMLKPLTKAELKG